MRSGLASITAAADLEPPDQGLAPARLRRRVHQQRAGHLRQERLPVAARSGRRRCSTSPPRTSSRPAVLRRRRSPYGGATSDAVG